MISLILIILIGIDFYIRKTVDDSFMVSSVIIRYSFDLIAEKYMFYGAIISAQIGYLYLYGNIEKDFNKMIIITLIIMAIMDIQGVINLTGFIDDAIYIFTGSIS